MLSQNISYVVNKHYLTLLI